MKFTPEQYRIADEKSRSFIDPDEIWSFINSAEPTPERVRAIIQKSLNKQRLSLADTAVLVQTTDPVLVEEI